jgi:hypothetical protein
MSTTTKVILGVTVAAAAFAAVGIMMSPEKGKRIRERTSEWLRNFSSLLATGKELVDEIKSKAGVEQRPSAMEQSGY